MKALTYLEYIHAAILFFLQVMKNLWDFLLFEDNKASDEVVII